MDDADSASKIIELELEYILNGAQKPVLHENRNCTCLYCGDTVEPVLNAEGVNVARWCGVQCRDEWSMTND